MWSYMMHAKSETILQALNVVSILGPAQEKSESVAPKPQLRILS
jgi:hypothetical protein